MSSKEEATYFSCAAEFRAWLEGHHTSEVELLVGFYKKGSGRPSMTWPESVDEALCFGWIDGIRKRVDDDRYTIRFTPRKTTSTWSAVNMARFEALSAEQRIRDAGHQAFARRTEAKSGIYAYEQRENAALSKEQERSFRANKRAWAHYQKQPPSYRKVAAWWVMSAKLDETRRKRLAALIECSERGERLPQYSWPRKGE